MTTSATSAKSLLDSYRTVRLRTEELCEPLETEDYGVQPMVDASPPKWHLAHTTWFFETFILEEIGPNYQPFNPTYRYLFNSYYENVGSRHPRPQRGALSRPTVREVMTYRYYVDSTIGSLLQDTVDSSMRYRLTLGLHHEQQHQELILTDLKANLGNNPLNPVYQGEASSSNDSIKTLTAIPLQWFDFEGGKTEIGTEPGNSFCFDNETPRHSVWLEPFKFANRLVTNGEFLEFINDGGYTEATLWLSDGWHECQTRNWSSPEYWVLDDEDGWTEYTLGGRRSLDLSAPATHISLYEADAFARWKNCRLPTEFEWEFVCRKTENDSQESKQAIFGNLADTNLFHPQAPTQGRKLQQLLGDCWEWTSSAYSPYPRYRPLSGALGEYNGKFMANQFVLRGGSCATPANHIRSTYRNFFYPKDRWQFTGIRLADNLV